MIGFNNTVQLFTMSNSFGGWNAVNLIVPKGFWFDAASGFVVSNFNMTTYIAK